MSVFASAEDLLTQSVDVPGVLGELTQHLQLQRPDRAVASTVDDLIEGESSDRAAGHVATLAMGG